MAARVSGGLITVGVINILIALLPICAGCFGVGITAGDPKMNLQGRELGPEFKQHIERRVPGALAESLVSLGANTLCSLVLLGGAVGLFMTQNWARWLTVGGSIMLVLTLCVHDIYQFAVYRPAVMEFLDMHLRNMPDAERSGFKWGFTASYFFWSCFNPTVMIYLFAMCLFLCVTSAFTPVPDEKPRRSRRLRTREYDDDEDDRPRRRRRGYDDEDDDDSYRRRRRRGHDDDDDDY